MTHVDAVVVGAGVVGLTTAISLAEAGLSTRIVTDGIGAETTSVAAGAIWGPVRCGPPDRIYDWSAAGLSVLSKLAADPQTGIRHISGCEVSATPASPEPWLDLLPDRRMLRDDELPSGMACGWRYSAPVAAMPVYLEYLRQYFLASGGVIDFSMVGMLSSIDAPVIVNCTGLGARSLAPDASVYPVRGQVLVVENPGIDEFYIDHTMHGPDGTDYIYIFPHGEVVVLGGTAEEGAWDLSPRRDIAERIYADCVRADPRLRGARVVDERVGLRPCRDEVRLEAVPLDGGRVLWHNYGHGGAGVTLAWGCAAEIVRGVEAG